MATSVVRPVCDRRRDDSGAAAPAGVVVAAVALGMPLRRRPAVPQPASHSDQLGALAGAGAVTAHEWRILGVHLRGLDGICTGCRAWWGRLTPYPCWQVEWATSRQARRLTATVLGGPR
ncbi:hypothetical protein [Micromonospora siamensis]|uniref:hypothetical protein n=1 Tax=Micromonospora siamensis TaxID=299152 RepID=UPI000B5AE15F